MICPHCDHPKIMFSDDRTLHFVRLLTNSPKRYCPNCQKKWRIKLRHPTSLGRELLMVAVAGILGFILFFAISRITESMHPKPKSDLQKKIEKGTQLMEQYRKQGGSPGGGDQDPSRMQEAMKYLK